MVELDDHVCIEHSVLVWCVWLSWKNKCRQSPQVCLHNAVYWNCLTHANVVTHGHPFASSFQLCWSLGHIGIYLDLVVRLCLLIEVCLVVRTSESIYTPVDPNPPTLVGKLLDRRSVECERKDSSVEVSASTDKGGLRKKINWAIRSPSWTL